MRKGQGLTMFYYSIKVIESSYMNSRLKCKTLKKEQKTQNTLQSTMNIMLNLKILVFTKKDREYVLANIL